MTTVFSMHPQIMLEPVMSITGARASCWECGWTRSSESGDLDADRERVRAAAAEHLEKHREDGR